MDFSDVQGFSDAGEELWVQSTPMALVRYGRNTGVGHAHRFSNAGKSTRGGACL